jgi:hypothetical protein
MLPLVNVEELNEQNFPDAFLRIRMLELAQGPILTDGVKSLHVSLNHLHRRIGLRVGAGISLSSLDEILLQALSSRAKEAWKAEQ